MTSSGLPAPLGAINRKPKQETFGLIPDDGFRELKTTNQQDLQNPKVHFAKQKPVLSMINKYNIAELSLVDRPVQGTKSGFGAVITRHPDNHDARYFNTENRDNFGQPAPQGPTETVANFKQTNSSLAGGNLRPIDKQGIKALSNLTGEIYSKSFDPQEQTDVQRSWLYQQDPGVRAVNEGVANKDQTFFYDNALSLPMGEGVHATKKFSDEPGAFRRIRQDVTRIPNQVITRK